jgi:phage baseplate assembly protein W
MGEQFTGSGWGFPMRVNASGGIALVSGENEIEEAMRLVLATAPGERPYRPEFGCAVHDLVFAPVNDETIGRIGYEVRASLDRWEPRVEVHDVAVTAVPGTRGLLHIDVRYEILGTNNPRNLVFPFYVIPEGEDGAGDAAGDGAAAGHAEGAA